MKLISISNYWTTLDLNKIRMHETSREKNDELSKRNFSRFFFDESTTLHLVTGYEMMSRVLKKHYFTLHFITWLEFKIFLEYLSFRPKLFSKKAKYYFFKFTVCRTSSRTIAHNFQMSRLYWGSYGCSQEAFCVNLWA